MSIAEKAPEAPETTSNPGFVHRFFYFAATERVFLTFLLIAVFVIGATYDKPHIAMWVGFLIAGYSAIANDSIQTIGTFIASNRDKKWWVLWLFIGGIFVATALTSWFNYDGDVSYGRLTSKGFETAPTEFRFLQVAAPLFLLVLTRMRMPVSTTFLLLTCFATRAEAVGSMLFKSMSGYVLAFVLAMVVWTTLGRAMKRWFSGPAHPAWTGFQWLTTGWLWSVWLMQDAANIAVFLPRSLSVLEVSVFCGAIFLGLGLLFYMRGEKIQEVVDEKTGVVDVRMATIIDLVYALILFYFKGVSNIPMSTTWVFVGLLGGRELALSLVKVADRSLSQTLRLMFRDLLYVTIGLVVSMAIALAVNPCFREDWLGLSIGDACNAPTASADDASDADAATAAGEDTSGAEPARDPSLPANDAAPTPGDAPR